MKNDLAGIHDLDDVTATIAEQRIHFLNLSRFEVRKTNLKRRISWAEW